MCLYKLLCNPGVHDIDIDLRQQKVVVTGNVTSDTLIRRLIAKTGKHAELWPEQANSRKKKQGKTENREKQSDPAESSEEINQNDNETVKVNVVHGGDASKNVEECNGNTAKSSDGGCGGVNVSKANEGCATGRTGVQLQEVPKPAEVRQTVVLPAGPVTEKKVSSVAVQVDENEASANEKTGGSTSNGGKKKKKKGKANNNNGKEGVTASTATVNVEHCGYGDAPVNRSQGHPGSVPISRPANESPPRHHHIHPHQYPPHYYAHPPPAAPVYTVSHHTAYPSHGAAYYAPPQPYSYAHVVHPGTEMEPRPYTYESEPYSYTPPPPSSSSQAPSDSFVLFSDENPNACSVM